MRKLKQIFNRLHLIVKRGISDVNIIRLLPVFSEILFYAISSLIILALTYMAFQHPTFCFLFSIFTSGVILLFLFPYEVYDGFFNLQSFLLRRFLSFCSRYFILDFFSLVYLKFFCSPRPIYFLKLFLIVFIGVLHIYVSRWYFIFNMTPHDPLSTEWVVLINLILFLGIATVYARFLINTSLILVPLAIRVDRSLLHPDVLYVFGESNEPPSPENNSAENGPNAKPPSKYSLFSYTRNYYNQYFTDRNPAFYRRATLFFGFCAMVGGSLGAYYSKIQADKATIQAEQAVRQTEHVAQQTEHIRRQTDIAALQAKIITEEEYHRRHPGDKPKK